MAYDPKLIAGLMTCHGLNNEQIEDFINACLPARVPPGTLLMQRGDQDGSMLFVRDGELEVSVGDPGAEIVVRELRRGDHAGASSLLRLTDRRPASVRTRTAATLLLLERPAFDVLLARHHPVVKNLEVEVLRDQVADLRDLLATLAGLGRGGSFPAPPEPEPQPGLLSRMLAALRSPESEPLPLTPGDLRLSPPVVERTELLSELVADLELVRVERGEVIAKENGEARDGCLVLQGAVGRFLASRERGQILLGVAGPGALSGIECSIDGGSPLYSTVAVEDCVVARVPHDCCADELIRRGLLSRRLRRLVLAEGFALHELARETVFRGLSLGLGVRSTATVSSHPDYQRACAAGSRLA